MSRWGKDASEFTVSVIKNVKCRTNYSYIPKPVLNILDNPARLTFTIKKNGTVVVRSGEE